MTQLSKQIAVLFAAVLLASFFTGCGTTQVRTYFGDDNQLVEHERTGYFERTNGDVRFVQHGVSRQWDSDGAQIYRRKFNHNVPEERIQYWNNGEKRAIYWFRDGLPANAVFFDARGQEIKQVEFDNGTGIDYSFFPNGTLRWEAFLKNGRRDGEVKFFDVDGNVFKTAMFENGVLKDVTVIEEEKEVTKDKIRHVRTTSKLNRFFK